MASPEVPAVAFKPRGYQLEMLNMSMERNIIVAMDTGSGKTLVAALRVQKELEQCSSNQRVWFTCPTVALVDQQAKALRRSITPAFAILTLSGNDGVDHWSSRRVWDTVLSGVSVVVCTYQVLLDALMHSFVRIEEIALIVFDEAHHCSKKHAANRILLDHYHPAKRRGEVTPKILGLTASPVQSIKGGGLGQIEASLNAISRTPNQFREELLSHVYIPDVECLLYYEDPPPVVPWLDQLKNISAAMHADMGKDPWVMFLREQDSLRYQRKLAEALYKGKTWCIENMRRMLNVAKDLLVELGVWATMKYLKQCISRLLEKRREDLDDDTEVRRQEFDYLASNLLQINIQNYEMTELAHVGSHTAKLNILIETLAAEWSHESTSTTAIIFVKTRNSVRLLSTILATHPKTKGILRIGTFVGLSANTAKATNLTELIDSKYQEETLDDLRTGKKNVLISTSVCEEGIDVSACNLVICYEAPANLRAFVQRRGRARSSRSKYIIMLADQKNGKLREWQDAEELMRVQYMDDTRQLQELERLESDEDGYQELVTPVGAKLTLDDSVSVLQHFCSQIPQAAFTSHEPIYVFSPIGEGVTDCCVHLPNALHPELQRHYSSQGWNTHRLARRDAAFQAMCALYQAGLLNEHLMPVHHIDEETRLMQEEIESRPNMVITQEQYNPWLAVAQNWIEDCDVQVCRVVVSLSDGRGFVSELLLPTNFPLIPETKLYIDQETIANVVFELLPLEDPSSVATSLAQKSTYLLLHAAIPQKTAQDKLDFPILCVPIGVGDLELWLEQMSGVYPAHILLHKTPSSDIGVVQDQSNWGARYHYLGTEIQPTDLASASQSNRLAPMNKPVDASSHGDQDQAPSVEERPMLKVRKFPKRLDFLNEGIDRSDTKKSTRITYVDPSSCTVGRLSVDWVTFAQCLPSLYHTVGLYLSAQRLATTVLANVSISPKILLEAISATSASNSSNYQRLEFLGDSLLSIQTSLAVMIEHPLWHEGYLSKGKHHEVSNARLSRTCIETGLSPFVLTKSFSGSKWKPSYNSDIVKDSLDQKREISTKTLADVVEALLGAAWISAGEVALLSCLEVFASKRPWRSVPEYLLELQKVANENYRGIRLPTQHHFLERLTGLLGYKFVRVPLLLEALTHPSYSTAQVSTPSYQRLEFLGDSILESIVTERIYYRKGKPLPLGRMHSIRTAAVNGNFLAYCALKHTIEVRRTVAHVEEAAARAVSRRSEYSDRYRDEQVPLVYEEVVENLSLPSFLRAAPDAALRDALRLTTDRFARWSDPISEKLEAEIQYPWTELAAFNAEKVYSDLIESTIAAIAIDQGYFGRPGHEDPKQECAVLQWLERVGVMRWLDRLLANDHFGVIHPKEEVGVLAVDRKVRYGSWIATVGPDGKTLLPAPKVRPTEDDDVEHETAAGKTEGNSSRKSAIGGAGQSEESKHLEQPEIVPVDGFVIEGDRVYCYNIYVDNHRVATATGLTRMEAETRVAERAVHILRKNPVSKGPREATLQPVTTKEEVRTDDGHSSDEDEFFDVRSRVSVPT